jgi:hypothetical protein
MTMETKANGFLASETDLTDFLDAWESGTLAKEAWTHAAHVAAAASYTWQRSPAEALPLLRARIRAFNEATGGQNTEDAGYHETLTHFWTEAVGHFVAVRRGGTRLEAVQAAVTRFGSRSDLPRTYYTHDVVRNKVARHQWVPPERLNEFMDDLLTG